MFSRTYRSRTRTRLDIHSLQDFANLNVVEQLPFIENYYSLDKADIEKYGIAAIYSSNAGRGGGGKAANPSQAIYDINVNEANYNGNKWLDTSPHDGVVTLSEILAPVQPRMQASKVARAVIARANELTVQARAREEQPTAPTFPPLTPAWTPEWWEPKGDESQGTPAPDPSFGPHGYNSSPVVNAQIPTDTIVQPSRPGAASPTGGRSSPPGASAPGSTFGPQGYNVPTRTQVQPSQPDQLAAGRPSPDAGVGQTYQPVSPSANNATLTASAAAGIVAAAGAAVGYSAGSAPAAGPALGNVPTNTWQWQPPSPSSTAAPDPTQPEQPAPSSVASSTSPSQTTPSGTTAPAAPPTPPASPSTAQPQPASASASVSSDDQNSASGPPVVPDKQRGPDWSNKKYDSSPPSAGTPWPQSQPGSNDAPADPVQHSSLDSALSDESLNYLAKNDVAPPWAYGENVSPSLSDATADGVGNTMDEGAGANPGALGEADGTPTFVEIQAALDALPGDDAAVGTGTSIDSAYGADSDFSDVNSYTGGNGISPELADAIVQAGSGYIEPSDIDDADAAQGFAMAGYVPTDDYQSAISIAEGDDGAPDQAGIEWVMDTGNPGMPSMGGGGGSGSDPNAWNPIASVAALPIGGEGGSMAGGAPLGPGEYYDGPMSFEESDGGDPVGDDGGSSVWGWGSDVLVGGYSPYAGPMTFEERNSGDPVYGDDDGGGAGGDGGQGDGGAGDGDGGTPEKGGHGGVGQPVAVQ